MKSRENSLAELGARRDEKDTVVLTSTGALSRGLYVVEKKPFEFGPVLVGKAGSSFKIKD